MPKNKAQKDQQDQPQSQDQSQEGQDQDQPVYHDINQGQMGETGEEDTLPEEGTTSG